MVERVLPDTLSRSGIESMLTRIGPTRSRAKRSLISRLLTGTSPLRYSSPRGRALKRSMGFDLEPLEPRLLMSSDLSYGAHTSLTLSFDADQQKYELLDGSNSVIDSTAAANAADGLSIDGSGGTDTLTLDVAKLTSLTAISF